MPEVERQQAQGQHVAFRADAAFAKAEVCGALETRDLQHAIRIPPACDAITGSCRPRVT